MKRGIVLAAWRHALRCRGGAVVCHGLRHPHTACVMPTVVCSLRPFGSRQSKPAAGSAGQTERSESGEAAKGGAGGGHPGGFTAPPNIGPGRSSEQEANPYKSWEHLSHKWLIFTCVGCLCAGLLAGQFVEVDERKIKPRFAKMAIIEAATKEFEFRPDLAATSIRVAFLLAARRAGCQAETTDESCAVPAGLNDVAGMLNYIATTCHASMEDVVSLVAIAAVRFLHGPYQAMLDDWRWGRDDAETAPARRASQDAPQRLFTVPVILRALGDLTDEESVALLACHAVGEFHEAVSGVDGATHTGKRYTLGTHYYRFLLAQERHFVPLTVQRTEDNKEVKKLPTSLVCTYVREEGKRRKRQCVFNISELHALLKNDAWRAIAERFATDEEAWQRAFQSAFTKMLDSHFKRLRVYSDPE